MLLDMTVMDEGQGSVTVTRSGRLSRKVRVTWPKSGNAMSFDSMWEYDYWLYLRHRSDELGIAHALRNTTKLPFSPPVTYEINGTVRTLNAYRPDFCVIYRDGRTEWVEIKGWENSKHLAISAAVARQYASLPLTLVTRSELLAIQAEFSSDIEGWLWIK